MKLIKNRKMIVSFFNFTHRAGTSGEWTQGFSDRIINSGSNEHGLDRQPPTAHAEIHPFFRKMQFSTKIYGFSKIFFRSKLSAQKVTSNSSFKINQEYLFQNIKNLSELNSGNSIYLCHRICRKRCLKSVLSLVFLMVN